MDDVVDPGRGASFGNRSVPGRMGEAERDALTAAAAQKIAELLDILKVDHRHDHNTRDTPARVARMMVRETLRGRFTPPPEITAVDDVERCGGLTVTGPIALRSTCAHHLMPIYGHAIIGMVPAPHGSAISPSQYDRVVDHFASRLQIQEELAKQIERFLVDRTQARGLAVRISAVHMCKTHRGVRASHASRMVNTVYSGVLVSDAEVKAEFLRECAMLERSAASSD